MLSELVEGQSATGYLGLSQTPALDCQVLTIVHSYITSQHSPLTSLSFPLHTQYICACALTSSWGAHPPPSMLVRIFAIFLKDPIFSHYEVIVDSSSLSVITYFFPSSSHP